MRKRKTRAWLKNEPLWFKDAVIYQLHVKSFADGNGDGVGDFIGLTQKLDYIQSLGVTTIWLLPFYPSPLKDDGYDIADYTNVHPAYGTLRDFHIFLREAHQRGLRVITEMVLNHTSDQHEWFQKSRTAKKGSRWRNFYVWSDSPKKYKDARIIFKDFESSNWTWDPIAKAYFWHRFYSHQPDLNFDNPEVRKMVLKVLDFWMDMGVDGLRLDAVPYLIEREGTNCENLPETHDILKEIRSHVDKKYSNRMLLAEANQWPEDAVAYFGEGDECHMAFHFPLMPRMFMALHMEDRYPIVDILDQTPGIPETCQWASFLRNHDELTLEMVTDEERDYMYRVYAKDTRARINLGIRRRLSPLLNNHRRKIELINTLLLSLPGTPIVYYGDELGMGDNIYLGDRNGVRTPMQWSADKNAGFSRANPQKLFLPVIIDPEYHYEAVNAELQDNNLSSLLWWMRRVIAQRRRFRAFSRGTIRFLMPENNKVLAFIRQDGDETILVVINLSRFSQMVELDLSEFADCVPEEVFSRNKFAPVRNTPYAMTLGPHDHFWFLLAKPEETTETKETRVLKTKPDDIYWRSERKREFETRHLPNYLSSCRWFSSKARRMTKVSIADVFSIQSEKSSETAWLLFLSAAYSEGAGDTFLLPVKFAGESEAHLIQEKCPQSVIAKVETEETSGILFDASYDSTFQTRLFEFIASKKKIIGKHGVLRGLCSGELNRQWRNEKKAPASQILNAEQSNTSIVYENRYFLKLYRRAQEGVNPDVEITRYLTEKKKFPHTPRFAGTLEYRTNKGDVSTLGLVQHFTPCESDGWKLTCDAVGRYFDRILSQRSALPDFENLNLSQETLPPLVQETLEGMFMQNIRLLGQRTAEMHIALSKAGARETDFAEEPFSLLYQRSVYQSVRDWLRRMMELLSKKLSSLPPEIREQATECLALRPKINKIQEQILKHKINAAKIRIHGDYHLGQVLFTGKDFVIIDFEGEPARPLSERRLKRSPFRDVAGMLRSFHYAASSVLLQSPVVREENAAFLKSAADIWYQYAAQRFLESYLETSKRASFIPQKPEDIDLLLNVFILDKAVYEVVYELNNRPSWLDIPLQGILNIVRRFE